MPNNEKVKNLLYQCRCWLADLRASQNKAIDEIQGKIDEIEMQSLRESRVAEPIKIDDEVVDAEIIIENKGMPERE